jgi:glycerol-3-phosphate dehydrogenase
LVAAWAERRRAKAPLARALAAMLSGQASSEKVLRELMERPLGTE